MRGTLDFIVTDSISLKGNSIERSMGLSQNSIFKSELLPRQTGSSCPAGRENSFGDLVAMGGLYHFSRGDGW